MNVYGIYVINIYIYFDNWSIKIYSFFDSIDISDSLGFVNLYTSILSEVGVGTILENG
jgi:hypothetical protein